jgi:HlyD family type I secretion membrane fusion protein
MIVFSLAMMSIVKVDRVVESSGKIIPAGGSLFVQPLDRAIVSGILVHPGDLVRKGQVLATLDPTFATADFKQLQEKEDSDQALVARLEAEQTGRPYRPINPSDPNQQLQLSIWLQRQTEFRQSVNDFDARIASSATLERKAQQDAQSDAQHVGLTSQLAKMQQDLVQKGWGSQALVVSSSDNRVQAERQLAESRNSASQAAHDLAALRAQRENYIGKWKDDLGVSLVTARNDLHDAQETLAKASKVHDLSKLVAPEDAVVLSIGNASVGSVIDPTGNQTPLFTLTPISGPLEADVKVDARDIGFIRKGDKVTIKLDAFQFTGHGTAQGVVKSISDGSFTQTDEGQPRSPFFRVRVAITGVNLRNVPKDFHLIPGMTLNGDILIGGRTIMAYLIEGALRTGSEAMREP